MIKEIIEGLSALLEPIASLSKDRRELKDSAIRAISTALNETHFYYKDRDRGLPKIIDRENMLVNYWAAAAIPLRHFDQNLSNLCTIKSEYWINPDNYKTEEIKDLGITLSNIRKAYKELLYPGIYKRERQKLN